MSGVVHAAGWVGLGRDRHGLGHEINMDATRKLVEGVAQGIRRFIYTSTLRTLATGSAACPADEATGLESPVASTRRIVVRKQAEGMSEMRRGKVRDDRPLPRYGTRPSRSEADVHPDPPRPGPTPHCARTSRWYSRDRCERDRARASSRTHVRTAGGTVRHRRALPELPGPGDSRGDSDRSAPVRVHLTRSRPSSLESLASLAETLWLDPELSGATVAGALVPPRVRSPCRCVLPARASQRPEDGPDPPSDSAPSPGTPRPEVGLTQGCSSR